MLYFIGNSDWLLPNMTIGETSSEDDSEKNIWLFNIRKDPTERNDLAAEMPHKVIELLKRMAYYDSTSVPCVSPKADPEANPERHGGFWQPYH